MSLDGAAVPDMGAMLEAKEGGLRMHFCKGYRSEFCDEGETTGDAVPG